MQIFQYILLIFLVVCAIAVSFSKRLLNSILIFMSYSLIMSIIWILLESPDLAITEAAVGAGVTSVLFFAIPEEEYGKKPVGAFRQWMSGIRDPYLGNVEVKARAGQDENEELLKEHQEEVVSVIRKVHDVANNSQYILFRKFYKAAALICCLTLTVMLLVTVAYLPPVGRHTMRWLQSISRTACRIPVR